MSTSNINLNELYFEYKVLPRIVGEPTFNHLHEILKQLKANTCAVPCTLGGGANGYLGMLVTPLKYATIAPGTPFVAPQMPGALLINPTDTQYQIAITKTLYDTALREHQTYILMQRALISLIQKCIDPKYTNAVRNRTTGQLPADIRLIMTHLFTTYGKITEHELQEKYDETLKLTYDVSEPIDTIFNAVEDLCEVAELADSAYTPKQQVHIGYIIISKQRIFRADIRKWMRKSALDKTWTNFVDHFRTAHQELRDTDATVDELGYHSANAIVEQIVERLREEEENNDVSLPPQQHIMEPPPQHQPTQPVAIPQANAVVNPNMAMLEQMMTNMTTMVDNMQNNNAYQGRGYGRGRGRGRNQFGRGRGRGRGRYQQRQRTSGGQYCHTHGNCAHTSAECETRGPEHNPDATFANRLGGSNNGCFWEE